MEKQIEIDNAVSYCLIGETIKDKYLDYPDIKDEAEIIANYKLRQKAYRYARGFFALVSGNGSINPALLPIVFRDYLAAVYESSHTNNHEVTAGQFASGNGITSNEKQAVVYIDLPRQTRATLTKRLKEYIRHEVIHYYLWLIDYPNDDDSAIFWAYCNIYDGGAYKELSSEEKERYVAFLHEKEKYHDVSFIALQALADGIIMNDKRAMDFFKGRVKWEQYTKNASE